MHHCSWIDHFSPFSVGQLARLVGYIEACRCQSQPHVCVGSHIDLSPRACCNRGSLDSGLFEYCILMNAKREETVCNPYHSILFNVAVADSRRVVQVVSRSYYCIIVGVCTIPAYLTEYRRQRARGHGESSQSSKEPQTERRR